jgi:glycosyltransferase involved in cell wall biosynthesis
LKKAFPKVIIIGETFRLNGGGGITMSNLFKEWPPENIGVVTSLIDETDPTTKYRYYQLGTDEMKYPLPFCLMQKAKLSGEYYFKNIRKNNGTVSFAQSTFINRLIKKVKSIFNKILSLFGLDSSFHKIRLSEKLLEWIRNFNPDIIYIQPFLHRNMRFGTLLYHQLSIPYAIHIMDDSISFINKSLLFRKRLHWIIDRDFRELISNARVHMCISESMAVEYESRYNQKFLTFRNPVEIETWLPYQKKALQVKTNELKIIYTGRLFSPTHYSLIDMCQVVDKLNRDGCKVILDIFTYDENKKFKKAVNELIGINLKSPVIVTEIPGLVQQYDIFFLCLDFDRYALRYSQYSISTRVSEGMISAVPILMYGPESTAMHSYFKLTRSGYCVGEHSQEKLENAIIELWHNQCMREELSINAVNHVIEHNNASVVRERFRQTLNTIFV